MGSFLPVLASMSDSPSAMVTSVFSASAVSCVCLEESETYCSMYRRMVAPTLPVPSAEDDATPSSNRKRMPWC